MKDYEAYAEAQRLAVIASAAIERVMAHAGLKRARLAEKLGVRKSRVSKVLDGEANLTLKTLAEFGLACDVRWEFVGVKASDPTVVITAPDTLGLTSPPDRYAPLVLAASAAADCAVTSDNSTLHHSLAA